MVKESITGLISRLKKAPLVRKIQRGKALQGGEILIGHPIRRDPRRDDQSPISETMRSF